MNKTEIFNLPNMTEEEQRKTLIESGVLEQKTCSECGEYGWTFCDNCKKCQFESMADCAFRLKNEVGVSFLIERQNVDLRVGFYQWWLKAKPIHWITAALLTKTGESK